MKKTFNRVTCFILSIFMVTVALCFTGCGPQQEEQVDEGKTQLLIGCYDGGFGDEFLYEYKDEFEALYEDYESPDGKKGVQVLIRTEKNYEFLQMSGSVAGWDRDIYITAQGYEYNRLAKQGAFLDITDIATQKLPNEDKSIAEKMKPLYQDWFEVDNKYYALPQYEGGSGISYDVDLFNDNNLFINKEFENDANLAKKFSCGENDPERAYGPDGIKNTYDDGLPATYDDFFQLCDRMVDKGITPVIWAGKLQNYMSASLLSLYADYEGVDNVMTHFRFDGKTDIVSEFDSQGNPVIVKDYEITSANGYDVFKQPGMYYALEFLSRLISDERYYNYNDCFGGAVDHLGAQEKFVYGAATEQPIGMLFDGSWWYNEAKGAREDFADEFPGVKEHRYAMLPMPKAPGASTDNSLMDSTYSLSFINAKIDSNKIDIAKKFLQFCFTNDSLSVFTKLTSTTCPYDYEMSKQDYDDSSYLAKKMYELHQNVEYIMPLNESEVFLKNSSIVYPAQFWKNNKNVVPSTNFQKLKYGSDGMTSKELFEEIGTYYSSIWSTLLP